MKYLKTYKLFESEERLFSTTEDFLNNMQDILLEIEDMGLHIKKNVGGGRYNFEIVKNPNGLTDTFEITPELSDIIQRISEYAKSEGWRFRAYEVNMGADKYFQMSGSDIENYIGEQAWFITYTITDFDWSTVNENYKEVYQTIEEILLHLTEEFYVMTWDDKDEKTNEEIVVTVIKLNESLEQDWDWDDPDYCFQLKEEDIEEIERVIHYMDLQGYDYKMEFGDDNIPPTPDVRYEDYRSEIKLEEILELKWWVDNYLRLEFRKR